MTQIKIYPWKYGEKNLLAQKEPIITIDADDIIMVMLSKHFKTDNTHYFYFLDKRKYSEVDNGDNCYGPNSIDSQMFFPRYTKLTESLENSEKILLDAGLVKMYYWNDDEGDRYYYFNPKNIERICYLTDKKDTKEYGWNAPVYVFDYKENYGHQLGLQFAFGENAMRMGGGKGDIPEGLKHLLMERVVTVEYRKIDANK